jgi:type I restriction enzyme S subunit
LKVSTLLGVSVQKVFIPSIANTVGTNFKNYKIVKRHQFVYIADTSRRGEKIGLAMLEEYEEALVSQAYTVFEIIDKNKLNPEYLMMWFRRPEFDRYARYKSHGSVREIFDWDEMCEVELPIPSIEKQNEIVKEYNTVVNRITLNEQLNQKLEETAQALYKHWFVDFNFPITKESCPELVSKSPELEGKPYKASGGEMVYNEELEKEIPVGWEVNLLKELGTIKGGKRVPGGESLITKSNEHPYIKVADMGVGKFIRLDDKFQFVPKNIHPKIEKYTVSKDDIIISVVGTIGVVNVIDKTLNNANLTENCVKITNLIKVSSSFLYHFFKSSFGKDQITTRNVGAVQAKLPIYNIETFPILHGDKNTMKNFEILISIIDKRIKLTQGQLVNLKRAQNLLLSKMTKAEIEKKLTN